MKLLLVLLAILTLACGAQKKYEPTIQQLLIVAVPAGNGWYCFENFSNQDFPGACYRVKADCEDHRSRWEFYLADNNYSQCEYQYAAHLTFYTDVLERTYWALDSLEHCLIVKRLLSDNRRNPTACLRTY